MSVHVSEAEFRDRKSRIWHESWAHVSHVYELSSVHYAVCHLLKAEAMDTATTDIVFACTHCGTTYVVDAAAAGVTLQCQNCSRPTTVPSSGIAEAAGTALRISELQHQLKENESQRTEITSYINQLSIQLHRWQLRLKDLNERGLKLRTELATLMPGKRT